MPSISGIVACPVPTPAVRFRLWQHRAHGVASRPTQRRTPAGTDRRPDDRRVQGCARPHQRAGGSVTRIRLAAADRRGNATALHPIDDDELVAINMSVWESIEALADYVYRSDHTASCAGGASGSSATARRPRVVVGARRAHPVDRRGARPPRRSATVRPDRARFHVRHAVRPAWSRRRARLPTSATPARRSGLVRRRAGRGRRCRSTGGAACSSPAPRSGGSARG